MGNWRFAGTAEAQVEKIVRLSEAKWGEAAADRYLTLIITAMQDVADAPDRINVVAIGGGLRLYHIENSVGRAPDPPGRVQSRPRHVVVFETAEQGWVDILGLFHDGLPASVGLKHVFDESP